MKHPTALWGLEVALIETQYALSDFSHEIEMETESNKRDVTRINDEVIRISISILHFLASISSTRAVKLCGNVSSSENIRPDQVRYIATSN